MFRKFVRSWHGLGSSKQGAAKIPQRSLKFKRSLQRTIESLEGRLALAGWSVQGAELQPEIVDFPEFGSGDNIGRAVAIYGDTAVVGVPDDDGNEGSIYIFKRTGNDWAATQRLSPSDLTVNDAFGFSVGISGNTIVVGAPQNNKANSSTSGIYIFERPDVSSPFASIGPKRTIGGDTTLFFGRGVAIEGDTIVAGAPWDDAVQSNGGSIVVYQRDTLTGLWPSSGTKRFSADLASGDSFGETVAISGNRIVAGAPFSGVGDVGAAYVFVYDLDEEEFVQEGKLTASDAVAGDKLGTSVDIDGTTVVSGTPTNDSSPLSNDGAAYVFDNPGAGWSQSQKLIADTPASAELFGTAVAIEAGVIAIGAPGVDFPIGDSGAVSVFEHDGIDWGFVQELYMPATDPGDGDSSLGAALAIQGASILAGAPLHSHTGSTNNDLGAAYVFVDINDEPFFTPGGDVTVGEDSPAYSEAGWATGISAGAENESGQALEFLVMDNSNPSLFAAGPAISADGTLTFTPAADANGVATITIVLMDDGEAENGGDDTSDEVSFQITVNAVNDAPSFVLGADDAVDEDFGLRTVAPWATAISAGPADEAGQTLSFVVTDNTNPGLFASGPTIDPVTGNLTYTPAANANGPATITVKLTDDGPTGGGNVNASGEMSFTITVNPVNDAPTANGQLVSVDEDGTVAITLGGSNIDETAESGLTFTIASLPSTGVLSFGGVAVQVDDTFPLGPPMLVYQPGAGSDATSASFDFTVTDNGDDSEPGQGDETSAAATVTIGIIPAVTAGTTTLDGGILRVGGNGGNDTLLVNRVGSNLQVSINGTTTTFALASVTEIRIWGRNGNDTIVVDTNVSVPATIDAGGGNDVASGGNGHDLIFGGDGVDLLFGNGGNDMLIGGEGSDFVSGGSGHDVVVAGRVAATFTAAMLRDVAAAWAANRTAAGAVDDGTVDETVVDNQADVLTGGSGADWYIVATGDVILGYWPFGSNGDVITTT